MQVIVLADGPFAVDVAPTFTVERLKAAIQDKVGIPASQQTLFLLRAQLENQHTLADYNIQHFEEVCCMHLIPFEDSPYTPDDTQ